MRRFGIPASKYSNCSKARSRCWTTLLLRPWQIGYGRLGDVERSLPDIMRTVTPGSSDPSDWHVVRVTHKGASSPERLASLLP